MIKNEYTKIDFLKDYPNDDACLEKIFQMTYGTMERCPNPKCCSPKGFKGYVRVKGRMAYQCRHCYNFVYPLKNTIFSRTHVPLLKWFLAIFSFTVSKNGVSALEIAREVGVSPKTSLRMLKRIREFIVNDESPISGEAQIDECFIGGLNRFRHHDKKVPKCQGRSYKDKVPVLGMVETSTGRVIAKVIKNVKKKTLQPLIRQYIEPGSRLLSDEYKCYKGLEKYYHREICNHSKKIYVTEGGGSTNRVENVWSCIKRSIKGSYIRVSKKWLFLYIKEAVFRYNNRSNPNIFRELLSCLVY